MAREVPGSYRQAFFRKSVLRISGVVRTGGVRVPVVFVVEDRGVSVSVGCDRRLWCGGVIVLDCGDT